MPDALTSRIASRGPGVGSANSLSSSFRSPRNTTPFMASSRAVASCVSEILLGFLTALGCRTTLVSPVRPVQTERRTAMTVYELRTYTLHVGKMAEAVKLYTEFGYPALQKGGQDKKLIGYFQADTATINQLVHLWKFDGDADRPMDGRGGRRRPHPSRRQWRGDRGGAGEGWRPRASRRHRAAALGLATARERRERTVLEGGAVDCAGRLRLAGAVRSEGGRLRLPARPLHP